MNRADASLLVLPPSDLRVDGRVLLRQLQLDVAPGECWAVVGANGRGKSTLLAALAGFDSQWRTRVLLQGRALADWPVLALARQRAWLGQHAADVFGLSVLQTVLLARHAQAAGLAWDQPQDVSAAEQALARFDVAHLAARDVRTLSGGERQRVALAGVWAQDCPLLLLDEPCNHLDLAHQLLLLQAVRQCASEGRSAILVLHDLNLVSRCATHVLLLMNDGTWLAGPVAELMTSATLERCLGVRLQQINHPSGLCWVAVATVLPNEETS